MKKNITKTSLPAEKENMLFSKKNYLLMLVGIGFIALGFLLMSGADANTKPDGVWDANYWNENIFSWRRIRLAPLLVIIGFIVEVYAILVNPKNN